MEAVTSTAMSGVTDSLTTSLAGIGTSALSMVGAVIPIVLPILGAFVVVQIGIKIFKKVTA